MMSLASSSVTVVTLSHSLKRFSFFFLYIYISCFYDEGNEKKNILIPDNLNAGTS